MRKQSEASDNAELDKDYRVDDFNSLLRYVDSLASHKMGYPVSLLTYLGVVDNEKLGIMRGTLANVLLNNVGDPFKDSETSLLEVKRHERAVIGMLEKYYGMEKGGLRGYVTTGGTEGNFASLWWSKRYIINCEVEGLIETDNRIKLKQREEQELDAKLVKVPLNDHATRVTHLQKIIDIKNEIANLKNNVQEMVTPTVFYCKAHTHYSIPKIAEVLRLNVRPVAANDDGSLNLAELKKELLLHKHAHPLSGAIVIANIGTTITGAIDDIPNIKKMLNELVPKHSIHMDGALTGFVLPVIKPFGEVANYFSALGVNTLAVSAHKYPGLSQPCGIILAEKHFFEKAFAKSERSIEYVGNILDVTISGSRSGLNVLMFYNALCTLGLDRDQAQLYKLVEENIANAKYLYHRLIDLYGKTAVYYPFQFNVMFPKPSMKLCRKYQLMVTGERATICVLSNVTIELIDKFIEDLKNDKEAIMSAYKPDYTIENLQEEHLKSATELLVKSFCDSEPITRQLNVRYQDYEPFAKEILHKSLKEGMSKVAVDKHHHVIGLAIAEDLADPFIPHLAHYPKLKPVFALIGALSIPFLKGRKFLKGKVAHVWIAAIDPAARGLGLSTEVDLACVENAARKGFDYVYAEFTNPLSEKVSSHFKVVKLINKIPLATFNLDGSKPFEGMEGNATSYVATIRPGVKLESLSNTYTMSTEAL